MEDNGRTERIEAAVDIGIRYGQIDGGDHKMWVIDQMLRALLGDAYAATIDASNKGDSGEDIYTWETGRAP